MSPINSRVHALLLATLSKHGLCQMCHLESATLRFKMNLARGGVQGAMSNERLCHLLQSANPTSNQATVTN